MTIFILVTTLRPLYRLILDIDRFPGTTAHRHTELVLPTAELPTPSITESSL